MASLDEDLESLKRNAEATLVKAKYKVEEQGAQDGASSAHSEAVTQRSATERAVQAFYDVQVNACVHQVRKHLQQLVNERKELKHRIDPVQNNASLRMVVDNTTPKITKTFATLRDPIREGSKE